MVKAYFGKIFIEIDIQDGKIVSGVITDIKYKLGWTLKLFFLVSLLWLLVFGKEMFGQGFLCLEF